MNKNFSKYFGRIFLLSLIILFLLLRPADSTELKIYFFDVGQGDSELIVMPGGQTILIDGGPGINLVFQLDKVLPFMRRQIDLMVLTHPHDDHLIGLLDVLKTYPVKEVLWTGVSADTLAFKNFIKIIEAKKIKTTIAQAGLIWQFKALPLSRNYLKNFSEYNLSPPILTVLYPLVDVSKQVFTDLNDSSVVLRLDYQGSNALFVGDLPIPIEQQLIEVGTRLSAQILKVGHHGSAYSSSLDFLRQVQPDWSVISCGLRNLFHHPSPSALARLRAAGSQVLMTKDQGTIILETTGRGLWYQR